MKQHGKKVDKTRRYFTYDDIRKTCSRYLAPTLEKATKTTVEICIMAFKDFLLEKGIYNAEDMVKFSKAIEKYSLDYKENEFSLTALQNYNRELPYGEDD